MLPHIKLYSDQWKFVNATQLYTALVGGRGAGKSVASAAKLLITAGNLRGLYGMYAPTYPLLRDTIQRVFCEIARPYIVKQSLADGLIRLANGSEIICRSLEDPEHARGPSLRGAVVDEASLCKRAAFDILIACLRYEGKQGWLSCTFTPRGPGHWTAEIFNSNNPDTFAVRVPTWRNPFNPPDFYVTLRRQYNSAFAEQELEGNFVNLGGQLFKREWFRMVDASPVNPDCQVRFWDLAATEGGGDWTSGCHAAWSQGMLWILDMRHVQESPAQVEKLIYQTAIVDGQECAIRMEEEGGSGGKITIDHYGRRVLQGFNFDGIRPRGDKMTRANPLSAAAEQGRVCLVKGPWNKAFLDELESFSPDCDHDDQVDAASGAHSVLSAQVIEMGQIHGPNILKATSLIDKKIDALVESITDPMEKVAAYELLKTEGMN